MLRLHTHTQPLFIVVVASIENKAVMYSGFQKWYFQSTLGSRSKLD